MDLAADSSHPESPECYWLEQVAGFCQHVAQHPGDLGELRLADGQRARRGLVALGCGTYGNVIRLLPPLVIEFSLLDEALDILAESLAEATA